MATAQRMTFADLLTQPDDGYRYELVRGEILRMPPTKGAHKNIESTLVGAIDRYLFSRAVGLGWEPEQGRTARYTLVGYLGSGDGGVRFSLPDDPDQTRGVDVLYLSVEQVRRIGTDVLEEEYVPEVPALSVEIISPSETTTYSNQKVTDYLQGGGRLVWQLYPLTRTVRVFRSDNTTWTVTAEGILDGDDILPGFSISVRELLV